MAMKLTVTMSLRLTMPKLLTIEIQTIGFTVFYAGLDLWNETHGPSILPEIL